MGETGGILSTGSNPILGGGATLSWDSKHLAKKEQVYQAISGRNDRNGYLPMSKQVVE